MSLAVAIASADPFFRTSMQEALEAAGLVCDPAASISLWDGAPPAPYTPTLALCVEHSADVKAWLPIPVKLATLRAQLHRTAGEVAELPLSADFTLEPQSRQLRYLPAGTGVALTEKECELLTHLHRAGEAGMPRQALLEKAWGYAEAADTHTLETHIHRLRAKLREAGIGAELIRTGATGYALC